VYLKSRFIRCLQSTNSLLNHLQAAASSCNGVRGPLGRRPGDEDDEEEEEDSGKGRPPRSVCKMREPPEPEAPPAHSDGKRIMD
jgi:hypothetical protein